MDLKIINLFNAKGEKIGCIAQPRGYFEANLGENEEQDILRQLRENVFENILPHKNFITFSSNDALDLTNGLMIISGTIAFSIGSFIASRLNISMISLGITIPCFPLP